MKIQFESKVALYDTVADTKFQGSGSTGSLFMANIVIFGHNFKSF